MIDDDAVRVAGRWRLGAERNGAAVFPRHRGHFFVISIQYPNRLCRENAGFRSRIGLQRVMPVEVIVRDVQYHRGIARERARRSELKARKLEDPHFGQIVFGQSRAQRVESNRCDVACDLYPPPGGFNHQTRKPAGRRFAVGAGHTDDLRRVARLRF